MPMYPYKIPSKYGWIFPYDTESNIEANILPGTLVSIHRPRPETRATGRVLIVQPVKYAGAILTASGESISVADLEKAAGTVLGVTEEGIPIILGKPIEGTEVKSGVITTMAIEIPGKGRLLAPIVAIVLIVAIAVVGAIAAITVPETILRMHASDLVFQSQQVKRMEYYDLDTGKVDTKPFEGADIQRVFWKNGDVWDFALTDKGKEFIGGNVKQLRRGKDFERLLEEMATPSWMEQIKGIVTWVVIGVIAIGGVYLAVKIIPRLFERESKPLRTS